jgi:hypothetical protein
MTLTRLSLEYKENATIISLRVMAGTQKIDELAAQSAFVFTGNVIKLKAATIQDIPTANTAVVQETFPAEEAD